MPGSAPPPVPCGEDASQDELREEIKRLRRELRRAELEARDPKKSHGVFCEGVAVKYAWIREHRDSFPVAVLCDALEVSASGYYAWLDRPPSPRAQRHDQIQAAVQQLHAESHGIYGSHKIARELEERPELESACRNTVAKAMRELGLKSRISRTFTPTTTQADPTKQPAPNQLAQDFTATAPNRKWVTDITYLPTAEGWVYLAVVLDLFSRKVVGWALSNSLATELVSAAPPPGGRNSTTHGQAPVASQRSRLPVH